MGCKYTYQGKTYESWEFADVLAQMPMTELARYLPKEAMQQLAESAQQAREDVVVDKPTPEVMASVSFSPMDYRAKIAQSSPKFANFLHDLFATNKTFNWFHKTLATQDYKASIDEDYRKVFDPVSQLEGDTNRFASEAADLAPDLVPKMDTLKEAWQQRKFIENTKDFTNVAPWVFYGNLAGINLLDPANVHYLSDPQSLIAKYGDFLPKDKPLIPLTERQIDLFRQFNAATNYSLDTLAKSEMHRTAMLAKDDNGNPMLVMADLDLSLDETAAFYFDQVAGEMDALEVQINELKRQQKDELGLLEDAANDEASDAEKRKTYAKLLMETKARHKAEMEKLQSKLSDYVLLKDGFIGKAEQINKLKSEGYASLMRFGKYTVDVALTGKDGKVVKDSDGNEIRAFFGMFESESEANAIAREMQELYPDHTVTTGIMSEEEYSLFSEMRPETVEAIARQMGNTEDEAFQKYLKLATANKSALKRLIHRKGTAGFSFDVTRVLASFITSNSRAASANLHMTDIMRAITDIPRTKGDVKDEAIKLLNFVRNPQEKGLAVRSLMFAQFLGGSVASAAVNMTQSFTTTLPYLSQAKFGGPAKAAKALAKAMSDASKRTYDNKYSTGDTELDKALKLAEEQGIVSPHEIHMLRGEASRGSSALSNNIVWRMMENKVPALRYASRLTGVMSSAWGGMFSIAEQYNRQVAFIAAYRLAKEQGATAEQAYEQAAQATKATQFDYSKAARSNFGRGVIGSTVMTFKTFLINYLELLRVLYKNDKQAFAIAVGVLFLLAGAQGLPGADDLDDLIDTLRQWTGHRGNSKEWKREILADIFGDGEFGKAASNFLLHGVSAFLPLDVSGRLSVGNIIPATSAFKTSDSDQLDDAMEIIGPVGSYMRNAKDFIRHVGQSGDVFRPFMDTLAPKALGDFVKSIDMLQTGAYRDYKGRKIVNVDGADAAYKFFGFQPNSVAEVRRVEREMQQDVSLYRNIKKDVLERWSRGMFEHDSEKVAKAKEQLAEWNAANPDKPMSVKMSQLQRRVQEMNKLSGERLVKAAPKEIRSNINQSLRAGVE